MKSKLSRVLYLGYYLKQMDWTKFNLFLNYVSNQTKKSKISIVSDVIASVFKYNISILEYFQFRFFEKNHEERKKWAGTGFMYEYQLKMNPISERGILDDKRKFNKAYSEFILHKIAGIDEVIKDNTLLKEILNNPTGKIVFKISNGKCGSTVTIKSASEFNEESIIPFMQSNDYDLIETFVTQHNKLQELSPSAVNTVRIFTQLNAKNEVEILGCRLRISVNSSVDNMAAGNMAATIDEKSGIVVGKGVYSDITKLDEDIHPITKVNIVGFEIPFWPQIIEMVKKAAVKHPQNKSIGWDIVVTENGPGFIEGNHDWCKLLWQLPQKKGLKQLLENHL